jgi:hypothetical protein
MRRRDLDHIGSVLGQCSSNSRARNYTAHLDDPDASQWSELSRAISIRKGYRRCSFLKVLDMPWTLVELAFPLD